MTTPTTEPATQICTVCNDPEFTDLTPVTTEAGESTGAGHCQGCEHMACPPCVEFIGRKGCPNCFW